MRGVVRCVVELAVLHTRARAHALHIAWGYALDVAHRVLVRQIAREHVADDFHVTVAVGAKASAGGDAILIDHKQVAKAHMLGVVVERK